MACNEQIDLPAISIACESREQFARRLSYGVKRNYITSKDRRNALKGFDHYSKHGGGRIVFQVEREEAKMPPDYIGEPVFIDKVSLYEKVFL